MRADPKERNTINNNIILSGKYELIRCLGSGQSSKVYLARHLTLLTERAVKIIPKISTPPFSVLSEAQLLKSMKHPGIPIIYDLEEDDLNYYLIEEYVQGESLEVYLLHQKCISQSIFQSFCKQLCNIFHYLHSLHPVPVLYQDLKPEHIIVCGLQLKLIDFGCSWNTGSLGNNFIQFGNIDFSAPECFSDETLSAQADIYSLGKIFQLLIQYLDSPISRELQNTLKTATESDPKLRFETVEALDQAIQASFQKDRQPHLCKSIMVVGSFQGCGCTHIAISIVSALNSLGINAFYFENNPSNNLRQMLSFQENVIEENGYYVYKYFKGFPYYGPGIQISVPDGALQIHDLGSDFSTIDLDQADLILLVCGSAIWKRGDAILKEDLLHRYREHLIFICNPGDRQACHFFAKHFFAPIHPYSFDSDSFTMNTWKKQFVEQLLSKKGRGNPFLNVQKIFHKHHKH